MVRSGHRRVAPRRFASLLVVAVLGLSACAPAESRPLRARSGNDTIPLVLPSDVVTTGAFAEKDIRESSAVVRSVQTPGVFWTLNDSGNDERLFAFDSSGADLGAVDVTDAKNRDWEALATGPCDAGRCLYVGDVGDNMARHSTVRVWRLTEPPPPGPKQTVKIREVERLRATYPDGAVDVEAMWVDADTVLWLATKRPATGADGQLRPVRIYRLPASAWRLDAVAVAELVDSLPLVPTRDERTQITDAALANPFADVPADSLLAFRTYGFVLVFRVHGTSGRPRELVAQCDLRALGGSGEGLTWLSDGRLFLTREGRRASLHALHCP